MFKKIILIIFIYFIPHFTIPPQRPRDLAPGMSKGLGQQLHQDGPIQLLEGDVLGEATGVL